MTAETGSGGPLLPVAEPAEVRRAAWRLIRPEWVTFVCAIVLTGLASAVGLVAPWLVGRIVDVVHSGGGPHEVDRVALIIVVCAVAQLLLARFGRLVGFRFGERALARIREQFFEWVMALPTSIVERTGAGDLAARGTSDVGVVASTLRDAGPDVLVAIIHALFIFGVVLVISPVLGVCGLLGLLGISIATRWYLCRARTAYLAQAAAHSVLAEIITATATGARTVEAFGLQQRRVDDAQAAIEECARARERTLALRTVFLPSVEVAGAVPVVAVLLTGGVLMAHAMISLGAVVAATLYLRQLSQPINTLMLWVEQLQSSVASFGRVEGVARVQGPPRAAGPAPDGDEVEVTDVHYAYDGKDDVLHGVNLEVRPGERLAVVGPSGAGKTTLGRLVAGIDAPRVGTVAVGGAPVAQVEPELRRRHILLVTQEHHVFLATVRDNLLIARPTATDAELFAALDGVGADWARTLGDGLDTELGAEGLRLDASQAQQLGLARVILADPHLVVLDEATSLLDPRTARHTERALAAVLKGRTVIAIAHRLHTARDADRVAVMEAGQLTEIGSHDQLVAGDGPYSRLWRSWHS